MKKKIFVVLGLGYGDEGKGMTVDYLVRKYGIKIVVRFNGGGQAAHGVHDGEKGFHFFSQFGAGTFVPGVKTLLSKYMLVNPVSMINEHRALRSKGVPDALSRAFVDSQCAIVTPFQVIINRMREIARGNERHGSCGQGIWETVQDLIVHKDLMLRAGDLMDKSTIEHKLSYVRSLKLDAADQLLSEEPRNSDLQDHFNRLEKLEVSVLTSNYIEFSRSVAILREEELFAMISEHGAVFEGAQGALLDEAYGFAPYVTGSRTTLANAEDLISHSGFSGEIERLGVLRAYATRHGVGPFVTEEESLMGKIPPCNNATNEWQGSFRLGWLDLVATRYAISLNPELSGIVITNLDRLSGLEQIRVCQSYDCDTPDTKPLASYFDLDGASPDPNIIGIRAEKRSSEKQQLLTSLLTACQPRGFIDFPGWGNITGIKSFVDLPEALKNYLSFLASSEGLGLPIKIVSIGPRVEDKIEP